jgi:hypothetical protein
MKEIRRRTRVVGAFPDGQACLNLAAARLRYIAGTAWSVVGRRMSTEDARQIKRWKAQDLNLPNNQEPLCLKGKPCEKIKGLT